MNSEDFYIDLLVIKKLNIDIIVFLYYFYTVNIFLPLINEFKPGDQGFLLALHKL